MSTAARILTVCLLATVWPSITSAAEVPAHAVSERTVAVGWIDLETLTPEAVEQSIDHAFSLWPPQTANVQQRLRERMAEPRQEFAAYHAALTAAGVRGALLGWSVTAGPEGEEEGFVLLHVQPGTTPEQVNAVLAEQVPGLKNPQLEPFERQWLAVIEPGMPAPAGGDADVAATFSDLLAGMADAPVRLALHQTPDVRAMREQRPVRDVFTGLVRGSVALRLGEALSLELVLTYQHAQQAENGAEELGWPLLGLAIALPELLGTNGHAAEQEMQELMKAVHEETDGATYTLRMDRAFLEAVGAFASRAGESTPQPREE